MSEQATTDRLHEIIRDTLWHLYGYWVAYEDAHPATHRRVNEDAEAIIEAIEQAGYALIERGRWERAALGLGVRVERGDG